MSPAYSSKRTVFALSTVLGKSGVAIIRISGPDAKKTARALGYKGQLLHKRVIFTEIFAPDSFGKMPKELPLDEILLLYFQAPNSFTGEDIIELHTHGSIAVIKDVLKELSKLNWLHMAEPGEFTRQAFENNKLDLTKVEALASIISAENHIQREIGIKQFSGALGDLYEKWRKEIIAILARLEGYIDFPEDDIPVTALLETKQKAQSLTEDMSRHLVRYNKSAPLTENCGIKIVLIGYTNVGKSSLINALSQKDVAIVSDIAGTTRDTLSIRLDLGNFTVTITDTAGMRKTTGQIELEGIKRAVHAFQNADICLAVLDPLQPESLNVLEFVNTIVGKGHYPLTNDIRPLPTIIGILNKCDLLTLEQESEFIRTIEQTMKSHHCIECVVAISTKTNQNIDILLNSIEEIVYSRYSGINEEPLITSFRQKRGLEECLSHLNNFDLDKPLELAAQDMRFAASSLEKIIGKIYVQEVLDEIFSKFCVGK